MIWVLLKFYLFNETFIPLKGSGRALHGQMAAPVINQFLLTTNILQRWRVMINHYLLLYDEIVIMGGKHCITLSHPSSQSCTLRWHLSVKFSKVLNEGPLPPLPSLPTGIPASWFDTGRNWGRNKVREKCVKEVIAPKIFQENPSSVLTASLVATLTNSCPWS